MPHICILVDLPVYSRLQRSKVTGITAYKRRPLQMYHTTIFVGMDVHQETFSLYCYSIEKAEFRMRDDHKLP